MRGLGLIVSGSALLRQLMAMLRARLAAADDLQVVTALGHYYRPRLLLQALADLALDPRNRQVLAAEGLPAVLMEVRATQLGTGTGRVGQLTMAVADRSSPPTADGPTGPGREPAVQLPGLVSGPSHDGPFLSRCSGFMALWCFIVMSC